ncbi:hypothetical protein ACJEBI_09935 [Bacillus salipaludis]|uniref:Uncharacterized protein n=2 Tax=Bacillus salipaludis TaxID=2547811 RepID=A0ABW8RE95_9BACI
MMLRKRMVAGLGALMLLGGVYGIQSVSAAENQPAKTEQVGKRFEVLSQFKEQIHQVNQLKKERLDLKKQMVEKKDALLDLLIAAKNSGNKDELKQAKAVKKQLKAINEELKSLATAGKDNRKALKEAVKKGEGSEQFAKRIAAQQEMNGKMKEKLAELEKMIEIIK